jgi:hypothetical protein
LIGGLDGPQNRSRRRGEEKNLLPLPEGSVSEPGTNSHRELQYLTGRLINVTDILEERDVYIFVVEDENTIFVRNID